MSNVLEALKLRRGEDHMKEFWNKSPLAKAFHCVHSLTLILREFIILWNSTRGDTRDSESICHSTREVPGPQLTICLTVSSGTFFSRCLSGLFYMQNAIFGLYYLCSRSSASGFQIYAYICIFTGGWVECAWQIIKCEGLCGVFVPEVALKSRMPVIETQMLY